LKQLLSEAEDMPIILDEVHTLKTHLNILIWAEKVKESRKITNRLSLKDVKKFFKELEALYNTFSLIEFDDLEISYKSPEEIYIKRCYNDVSNIILDAKDIISTSGSTYVLKKGAQLSRVIEIIDLLNKSSVDVDILLEVLNNSVSNCNLWVTENERYSHLII
jgi:hypothetical protein